MALQRAQILRWPGGEALSALLARRACTKTRACLPNFLPNFMVSITPSRIRRPDAALGASGIQDHSVRYQTRYTGGKRRGRAGIWGSARACAQQPGEGAQPLPVYATSGVIGTFALPPDSMAASSAALGGASSSKGNFSPL